MADDVREQLIKHLTDAHSIEEQALTQMRRAPNLAGDDEIARDFARHEVETRRHESLVAARLEALGAEPSKLKDLAGKAGGLGMLAFARVNPDTPGKLVAHAYSYEHMELATYELLARVARAADDASTVAASQEIAAEEREMASRLEGHFGRSVEASLREQDPGDIGDQLNGYLADAHALEQQAISLLQGGAKVLAGSPLASIFDEHLSETRDHERRVEERLASRGSSPSRIKDLGLRLGGLNIGAFFAVQPDTPVKLAGFAFAFEHLEVAGYEQLRLVAERAGDEDSARAAAEIAEQERAAAARIAERWDEAVEATIAGQRAGG